jgi:hypothetical protein
MQQSRTAKARYYHVRARNLSRAPAAHDVQIVITRIETVGPSGLPQAAYTGPLPLTWRHAQLHPVARTVGPDADADLFFVLENKPLEFVPMLTPNNFPIRHDGPVQLWVTIQARATEGDSAPLRLHIAWNGKWAEGEAEMGRHL